MSVNWLLERLTDAASTPIAKTNAKKAAAATNFIFSRNIETEVYVLVGALYASKAE